MLDNDLQLLLLTLVDLILLCSDYALARRSLTTLAQLFQLSLPSLFQKGDDDDYSVSSDENCESSQDAVAYEDYALRSAIEKRVQHQYADDEK